MTVTETMDQIDQAIVDGAVALANAHLAAGVPFDALPEVMQGYVAMVRTVRAHAQARLERHAGATLH